jgi:general stress protein YciG
MAGTREGGLKAAATNKLNHGDDFYARIGAKGGSNGTTGGFYANRELARIAGAKGGKVSKRKPRQLADALGVDGERQGQPHSNENKSARQKVIDYLTGK